MPHDAVGMALMEDPFQWFGKVIRGIDDTRDELHHNVPRVVPVLMKWGAPWLHFPLRNSSFPHFPFLLDPVSQFLVSTGKQGSMIQSIYLHFLLLRKHDLILNNF